MSLYTVFIILILVGLMREYIDAMLMLSNSIVDMVY